MTNATIETLIELAAKQLDNIEIWNREVVKCNRNLEEWTKRLIDADNGIQAARDKYQECLAEIHKRKEGD